MGIQCYSHIKPICHQHPSESYSDRYYLKSKRWMNVNMYISYTHIYNIYILYTLYVSLSNLASKVSQRRQTKLHPQSLTWSLKIMFKQYKPPFLSERMDKRSRAELLNFSCCSTNMYKPIFFNDHVGFFCTPAAQQSSTVYHLLAWSSGFRSNGSPNMTLQETTGTSVTYPPPWKIGENIFESTEDVGGYRKKSCQFSRRVTA